MAAAGELPLDAQTGAVTGLRSLTPPQQDQAPVQPERTQSSPRPQAHTGSAVRHATQPITGPELWASVPDKLETHRTRNFPRTNLDGTFLGIPKGAQAAYHIGQANLANALATLDGNLQSHEQAGLWSGSAAKDYVAGQAATRIEAAVNGFEAETHISCAGRSSAGHDPGSGLTHLAIAVSRAQAMADPALGARYSPVPLSTMGGDGRPFHDFARAFDLAAINIFSVLDKVKRIQKEAGWQGAPQAGLGADRQPAADHTKTVEGRPLWTGSEPGKANARVTMEVWGLQASPGSLTGLFTGDRAVFGHISFVIHDGAKAVHLHGFNTDAAGNRLEAFETGGTLKMFALTPEQSAADMRRHGHGALKPQAIDSIRVESSAQLLGRLLDLGERVNAANIPYHTLRTNSNALAAAMFNVIQPDRADCSIHSCPALLAAGKPWLVPGVDSGIAARIGTPGHVFENKALGGTGMLELARQFDAKNGLHVLAQAIPTPQRPKLAFEA